MSQQKLKVRLNGEQNSGQLLSLEWAKHCLMVQTSPSPDQRSSISSILLSSDQRHFLASADVLHPDSYPNVTRTSSFQSGRHFTICQHAALCHNDFCLS